MRAIVGILTLAGALTMAAPAMAMQCVEFLILDAKGVPIKTDRLVGLMVGGSPVVNKTIPPHASKKVTDGVPCPLALLDSVHKLFQESCSSEDRRQAAARDNGGNISAINDGCANMIKALTE
jgi:hypothetical protein